eukprot:1282358-Lingulodinium_polyedra.AAC.1
MIVGAWTTVGGKLDPNVSTSASAGASSKAGSSASAGSPANTKFLTRDVVPGAKTLKELKDL